MDVTLNQIVALAAGVSVLLSLGLTVWTLLSSGSRQNGKRLDGMDGRLGEVERSLERLDVTIRSMPDREMVHRIELQVSQLAGRMDVASERLGSIAAISERMQELLLSRSEKD